ncbi:NADP-dependent oxidoreductase domain-containing protein [Lipomyces doorenjongii]|uniref:NADP-dependent oxidoreductase domain-containing protein n=1 Tax=Lipomyces doorenjongii TaxID=383834 RepID=UPI0034CF9837
MATGREFTLNTGAKLPAVGLGTWQSSEDEVYNAVMTALQAGYRHIDSAFAYGNESAVGRALKASGVPREEIFLTTKLWSTYHTRVAEGLAASLNNLGVDYLDLYLMHWPVAMNPNGNHPLFPTRTDGSRDLVSGSEWDFTKTYSDMQKLLDTGKVKAIGVSNFSIVNLKELLSAPTTTIVPAVNQVELHPYNPQPALISFCAQKGVHVTGYSPLGSTAAPLQEEAIIQSIASKTGTTPAQVLISWAVARGTSVVPKSVTPNRIVSNFNDFVLSKADVAAIDEISKVTRRRMVTPNWGVTIFHDEE